MGTAAVAGVASHFAMSVEIVLIDGCRHLHHLASHLFRFFVVFLKCSTHVAMVAADSQGCSNELHCGNQLLGRGVFQNLDILKALAGGLWRSAGCGGWR